MEIVVKALYNAAFTIWNAFIDMAMTLFSTSPTSAAGGSPYATVHALYNSISAATIPIATCFFVIAIYKSVITSPPHEQATRFLMDGLRYCIILFVAANLWQILGYIIEFSDGITSALGSAGSYRMSVSGDLERIIYSSLRLPEFELSGEWFGQLFETIGCSMIFMMGGLVLLLVMVASCISIISSAFQRIIKPLLVMPFAGIAVAMGAGGHEIGRSMVQFLKTFFGFCISGAMMVIVIKAGYSLCLNLVNINLVNINLAGGNDIENVLFMTVQAAVAPIVIAGLVKTVDSVVARMF